MTDAARIPVIIATGEILHRPEDVSLGLEPVVLMAQALEQANAEAGGSLLADLDSLDLVGQITWRYADPVGLLCEKLGVKPARAVNASMGGETPIRLVHEAALRIARGEGQVSAIVGGESMHALGKAKKAGVALPWTPPSKPEDTVKLAGSRLDLSDAARAQGLSDPSQLYPLYENAFQSTEGQTPGQARAASAALWARYAAVAADNPYAWIRNSPAAEQIATVTPDNRLIAWPYPKLMVANPMVNQASAIIVTSLARARAAGIAEDRLIHIWGGAAAKEPGDFLQRDRYDHSTAQEAVLERAQAIAQGERFDLLELYSCFPVVPKMALKVLGETQAEPTVTGGITFFGGPMNNYMSHAVCAMVRRLREAPDSVGLLYGQGGFVDKHHALVVSTRPAPAELAADYSVQAQAEAARDPVPTVLEAYEGPAAIETWTVLYSRAGEPSQGVVVARTPRGERVLTTVDRADAESLAVLTDLDRSPAGAVGQVRRDVYGQLVWEAGEAVRPRAPYQFCSVEREGPLTLVTINRPEAMNALNAAANAELAQVFNDFAADPQQWVAILTGAGERAFSSGNDLKGSVEAFARGEAVKIPLTGFAGLTSRFDLNKPVIAAVNGVAMGGGFEIALACDLIIAADTAVFALPEPKVGLAALAGGLHRLPRQIGMKNAMGMILTGRRVPAAEGQALGFVNEVVAPAELMATARRWAADIIACSPMSIRASKETVQKGLTEPTLQAAIESQGRYGAVKALFKSDDVREGPLAFAQKRPPQWKGR